MDKAKFDVETKAQLEVRRSERASAAARLGKREVGPQASIEPRVVLSFGRL